MKLIVRVMMPMAITCALAVSAAFAEPPVLVTTFTNPEPAVAVLFPTAIAGVGTDHVLFGAPFDHLQGDTGAAYLFNTDGRMLHKFTNPETDPETARWGWFGLAVAALGSDRVIIAAPNEDVLAGAYMGKVYLFN